MSLRQLVDGDCGGVNPLMQLGGQFTRDVARKDEGFAAATQFERSLHPDERMVSDYLGQVAAPPQYFQMQTLLQEMRDIEQTGVQRSHALGDAEGQQWSKEFGMHNQFALPPTPHQQQMVHVKPQQHETVHVHEFFNDGASMDTQMPGPSPLMQPMPRYPMPAPYLAICPPYQPTTEGATSRFFEEAQQQRADNTLPKALQDEAVENWINDYQTATEQNEQSESEYNEKFWKRLQDEWQKLSEDSEHPWLSEFSENYDPYKEYQFAEENPMSELENAFEKGKEYLAKGDIPSAVMCFEAAAKKEPDNAEVWELLGISQAENEMDPQSIAALKRSLQLKADNPRALMALAVCYTNESLQSHAVRTLINWLQINPKYQHLVNEHPQLQPTSPAIVSSLIMSEKLEAVQNVYLEAVRLNPQEIDADVQEALGVLYNLSSEYDKAADCFRAALHINPQNAKVWNRLGASLANGSRSVEAVEAYQRALEIEPGFIRVRYNVGVCCMNLKAYKQAAEHLLVALNMQANSAVLKEVPGAAAAAMNRGQQQMSESIWNTLKMVISLMGRSDLHGFVNDRNLSELNEAFKD